MKLSHLVLAGLAAWGCQSPSQTSTGESTQAVEWVGFHAEVPWAPTAFHSLVSGLIGPDAQNGNFVTNQQIVQGVYLSATAETTTTGQSRVALTFDDGSGTPRSLAVAPASFAVGTLFLTTIDAALAKMQADNAQQPGSGESFLLQYKVVSPQGGTFTLGVHAVTGVYTLVLDVASPPTNLPPGKIGTPASNATPYDTIDGTVWFHLSKDDFDFFVGHAYGQDGTGAQNFDDFALEPHNWLRLTVTPHLSAQYVNVAFDVLGLDGTRTPVAQAPASVLAGSLFQAMVDRNMSTMLAQEQTKAGSSTPWEVPFYYNAPVGGGVVQVIAQGTTGVFVIAYAVEAPQHALVDVPFLAYEPVAPPPEGGASTTACNQLGNPGIIAASQGAFSITFTASSEILSSPNLPPLVGDIDCSVYNASDVDIAGPKVGAQSLNDFVVPHVNLQASTPPTYLTTTFPDGDYQILCAQDLNGNGNVDPGEPITLPVGDFPLACNVNPVTVQFAILDPANQ